MSYFSARYIIYIALRFNKTCYITNSGYNWYPGLTIYILDRLALARLVKYRGSTVFCAKNNSFFILHYYFTEDRTICRY